jgi:hypothetical protein
MEVITDLALCILWGIVFAYVIKVTSSNYYYIKGIGFGFVIWMVLTSLGTLFNVPLFTETPLNVAYTTLFTALVFGLVVAWVLKFLNKRPS